MTTISVLRKTSLLPGISYLAILLILLTLTTLNGDQSPDMMLSSWKVVGDALWVLGQSGVLVILYCMYRLRLNGERWIHKVALLVPSIGAVSYIVGTVWNVEQVMKFFGASPMLVFYPLGAFLLAAGMVWIGIQIIKRDDRWTGWEKFTPLIVGIYPFVVMFPVVMITGYPNVYLIMLWGLPWLLFGISLNRLIKRSPY